MLFKLSFLLCCFIGFSVIAANGSNGGANDSAGESTRFEPPLENLTIRIQNEVITVISNEETIKFENFYEYYMIVKKGVSHLKKGEFSRHAFSHIKKVIRKPDIQLKTLKIQLHRNKTDCEYEDMNTTTYQKYSNQLEAVFNLLESPLQVHTVIFDSFLNAGVLENLKAGQLEKIQLKSTHIDKKLMESIVKLHQWKKAKTFSLNAPLAQIDENGTSTNSDLPIEWFFNFSEFRLPYGKLTEEDLIKIRDVLLNSEKFQYFSLALSGKPQVDEVFKVFGIRPPPSSTTALSAHHRPLVGHYKNAKSETFLIKIDKFFLRIQRKH